MITSAFFSKSSLFASSRNFVSMFSTVMISPFVFLLCIRLSNLFNEFFSRPQSLDFRRDASDDLRKTIAFGGGNPGKHGSVAFHTDVIEKTFQRSEFTARNQIARYIMTLTRMTSGNQNSIGAGLQGFHYIERIDSSGAGNADNAHIRRILNSADSGQVGSGIGTPVADNSDYFRFPFFTC